MGVLYWRLLNLCLLEGHPVPFRRFGSFSVPGAAFSRFGFGPGGNAMDFSLGYGHVRSKGHGADPKKGCPFVVIV
jgi:hypothetical protein